MSDQADDEERLKSRLKERDEIRLEWRLQIERGWLQAQADQVVDGDEVFCKADECIRQRSPKG